MFKRLRNWLRKVARRKQLDSLLPAKPAPIVPSRNDVRNAASHLRTNIVEVRYAYHEELGGRIDGLSDNLMAVIDAWEYGQRRELDQRSHVES